MKDVIPNCFRQSCRPFKKFLELLKRVPQNLQLRSRTLGFFSDSKNLSPRAVLGGIRLKDLLF